MPHVLWKDQQESDESVRSSTAYDSSVSHGTQSTAPTEDSRPCQLPRAETCLGRLEGHELPLKVEDFGDEPNASRVSIDTYTSTIASSHEEIELEGADEEAEIGLIPRHVRQTYAIPSTPRDFADFFPDSQRLLIGHDESTSDGNMNLRVDTEVMISGSRRLLTLFHLRMYDLPHREMSLRRYCRDSGREVCKSQRVYQAPGQAKNMPGLQKTLNGMLGSIKGHRSQGSKESISGIKRHDSGYESTPASDIETASLSSAGSLKKSLPATNTIRLEFSNYAHVDLTRRGTGQGKRYDFEYWGARYEWKRYVRLDDDGHEEVSFSLYRNDYQVDIARISPIHLSRLQAAREDRNGGWIPPCTMELTEDEALREAQDIADVIVATGLFALVDDCLKRKCGKKPSPKLSIPLYRSASFRMNMELVGPKRLLNEAFHRPGPQRTSSAGAVPTRRAPIAVQA